MLSQAQVDALLAALVTQAQTPASASNDNGSVTARDLREVIEAIRFVAAAKASQSAGRGISLSTLTPAGAVFSANDMATMDPREWAWQNRRF